MTDLEGRGASCSSWKQKYIVRSKIPLRNQIISAKIRMILFFGDMIGKTDWSIKKGDSYYKINVGVITALISQSVLELQLFYCRDQY